MHKPGNDMDGEELALQRAYDLRTQCPPLQLLLAAEEKVLPDGLQQTVASHRDACPLCDLLLKDYATLEPQRLSLDLEQHVATEVLASIPRKSRWIPISLWGVAAALLILAATTLRFHSAVPPTPQEPTTLIAQQSAMAEIPFLKLPPPDDLSPDLVTRGTGQTGEAPVNLLFPAFESYGADDYMAAEERFEGIANQFPKSFLSLLYLAISQLALHRNREALVTLQKAAPLAPADRMDEVRWYEATAQQRLGDGALAAGLLQIVCRNHASRFATQSCQLSGTRHK
jgi:hypothetical protein